MDRDSWAAAVAGLSGGENVALVNNGDPKMAYYIAKLADEPWFAVPAQGLRCEGLFGDDGEPLTFLPGERLLCGYLYSLRNRRERNYELHDETYARTVAKRERSAMHHGWPLVYFRSDMVLHMFFHV